MKIQRINKRSILKVLIDGIFWSLITYFAFYLRLAIGVFEYLDDIFKVSLIIIPIKLLIIILNGHYKLSWRYSTFMDFRKPAMSILYLTIIYYLIITVSYGKILIPRTVPAIDAALTLIAFLLIRMAAQISNRRRNSRPNGNSDKTTIIIAGAGDSGTMIAKEMLRHPEMNMLPIGFLDDDPNKSNQRIAGIPVLGKISDIGAIIINNHIIININILDKKIFQIVFQRLTLFHFFLSLACL
jgi:FlaA1/EpsC-like NDP-sugar epimerase